MARQFSYPNTRLRRLRQSPFSRKLLSETQLSTSDLIYPIFVQEGENQKTTIDAMPECFRLTIDLLVEEAQQVFELGIPAILLFPVIPISQKSLLAEAAYNPNGLIPKAIRAVKSHCPDLGVITDVALDPYTLHGHDGIVNEAGCVLNDQTIEILIQQACIQADAGSDMIAPSDMMDGRIGLIRKALDAQNHQNTAIAAYSVKYASNYYGPFREAIGSVALTEKIQKTTYQLDPKNHQEALREIELDIQEGADFILIKPGMPYLDVLYHAKQTFQMPTLVYQVSGEYAMHMAAIEKGWLSPESLLESLYCLKRSGADAIITYFAKRFAEML